MIAVYGPGTLGRRIAARLADVGAPVALVGRDRARLDAVAAELELAEVRVAPIHDRAALLAAFADATVVIGCAGPFARVGGPVAAAALAAGAHHLDVATEPAFARMLYEEHESEARRAGRCLVSGVGVVGALGDWAAHWAAAAIARDDEPGARLAEDDPLDEVRLAYTFDGARLAAGLGRSLVAALTAPTVAWRGGRWDDIAAGVRARDFDFGALGTRRARELPTLEAITVPRHVAVRRIETYVAPTGSPWIDRALGAAAPLLRWLPGLAATVDAIADQGPAAPDDDAHAASRFAIVVEARRAGASARIAIAGHDLYATSAAVCAQVARALAGGVVDGAGVLAPSQLLSGERALGMMTDVTVTTSF